MSVKIAVCMKQVPDPEGPPASFEVDAVEKRVRVTGIPPVMSPFDENALEAALRIKESSGGSITVFSAGKGLSRAVLLKAMATGADGAVLVQGDGLDSQSMDSYATASILSAAIREFGPFDLVLTGRQAADTNAGQVGPGVAHMLGLPAITLAQKVEVSDGGLRVESVLPDGFAVIETRLPALVTVSHEVGDLRYPALAAIRKAKELPVKEVSPDDLGIETPPGLVEVVGFAAPSRERNCVIVEGETPEEAGENLAGRLRADGVI